MSVKLEMPKLSDTMTEGTLVKWKVAVGDQIEIGDVIAEIQTDKAAMEMEAFDEGVLAEILVEEGSVVPVGTVIGILAEDGETVGSSAAGSATSAPAAAASAPAAPAVAPASAHSAPSASAPVSPNGERIKASPLARKIAAERGIDLSTITGTGPGGRITSEDLTNVTPSTPAPAKPAATPEPAKPVATPAQAKPAPVAAVQPAAAKPAAKPAAITPVTSEEDTIIPLTGMRKIIAERLLTSKQTIPHFYLHVEVDAEPMMKLRQQVNAQAEQTHGNKFTFNDFVVKAMINACAKVPAVNASFNGDSIVQFANVGVSVAIAVEDGLVTPVVKNAQTKSLLTISQEIKAMAARAREGKLLPNEFDNGTITISNLGAWGIESFDAIVNPPQAAIVSVGGIIDKPVVVNGEIVPGKRMNLGLSCDHRVVDGAVAATYLNEVKKLLEQPSLMLI